jgi:hypothetical protein
MLLLLLLTTFMEDHVGPCVKSTVAKMVVGVGVDEYFRSHRLRTVNIFVSGEEYSCKLSSDKKLRARHSQSVL